MLILRGDMPARPRGTGEGGGAGPTEPDEERLRAKASPTAAASAALRPVHSGSSPPASDSAFLPSWAPPPLPPAPPPF